MTDMKTIEQAVSDRILVLDGAMGTMIQRCRLTEDDFRGEEFRDHTVKLQGNNDMLVLTRPDIIASIHRQYLEAGADIIETDTFNAQAVSQAEYHTESLVRRINMAAARIARAEADRMTALTPHKPRYVAGSVGPTGKTASMSPDVENPAFRAIDFDTLREILPAQPGPVKLKGLCFKEFFRWLTDSLKSVSASSVAEQDNITLGTVNSWADLAGTEEP